MSARTSAAQLAQAMKELSLEWNRAREQWADSRSRDFEKKYLAELPLHIDRTVDAMEEIETLLKKIHADCD